MIWFKGIYNNIAFFNGKIKMLLIFTGRIKDIANIYRKNKRYC